MRRDVGERGQASLEAIATIPLMLVALLVTWQLAAFTRATIQAREDARTRAIAAGGTGLVRVDAERRVRSIIPGLGAFRIRLSAATEAP